MFTNLPAASTALIRRNIFKIKKHIEGMELVVEAAGGRPDEDSKIAATMIAADRETLKVLEAEMARRGKK